MVFKELYAKKCRKNENSSCTVVFLAMLAERMEMAFGLWSSPKHVNNNATDF